jgi:DNA-binding MarR family transcriptional regulator
MKLTKGADMADPVIATDALLQQMIDRFWESVPPTWNRIRTNVRGIAAEKFGITVEQFHILRHIRKGHGSVSELAEAKGISRPAISQAVELLVNRGLVSRRQNAEDRRFVQLELTENGAELLSAIFRENRAWMEGILCVLTPEQMTLVSDALDVLKSTFEESSSDFSR